ncbi:CHAP domain-containing protein [Novosphingobium endophyticum]|nr:CHAP domain-containing protein [Novosphingobium endophyticum]
MKPYRTAIVLGLTATLAPSASARSAIDAIVSGGGSEPDQSVSGTGKIKGPDYLECVPFARQLSGIQIYGDAHTWWKQAKGRYARGSEPRVGAVLAIEPHGNSTLGHVAAVSRIVDSRTILVSHANWSIPGKIERNVTVLDVSPRNDWSEIRVWYAPSRNLGASHWPVAGFIYNEKPGEANAAPRRQTKPRHEDPIGAIIAGTYRGL